MLLAVLMASGGLVLLLGGGEVLLRGAVTLARRLGLSPLLIGLTVVAAATSMPELVITVTSGLEGFPNLGVGNVLGSNIANVLLILGAAAALWPIATRPRHVLRDGVVMLGATGLFMLFAFTGTVGRPQGVVMLIALGLYVAIGYVSERRLNDPAAAPGGAAAQGDDAVHHGEAANVGSVGALLFIAVGAAAMIGGSHLTVEGAVVIARGLGVSDAVIGLTLVAVGTSLPELATAVVAGMRRHSEIALGNVLGSNLFNLLAVLAALALVTPFRVAEEMLAFDLWVVAGVSLVLLPVMLTGWRIGRREGALFLVAYAVYVGLKYEPALLAH